MNGQEQLIKKINTEKKFSDIVFKRFRTDKYGITFCCPTDLEGIIIDKELCDWQGLKTPVYTAKDYSEISWSHNSGDPLPSWGTKDCGVDDLLSWICVDKDTQCIVFEVINQNGTPIEGYPIVLDGGNIGITDINGSLRHTITNASTNTAHTFDLCYCFSTIGLCNQKKITLTLTEECPAEECVIPVKVCEVVPAIIPTCDTDSGPTEWSYNPSPCTSTMQCTWEFADIKINGVTAAIGDYIACFSPTTGVLCGWEEITVFPVVILVEGNDFLNPCTSTYIVTDETPRWGIYDSSECTYCEGTPSVTETFINAQYYNIPELECL
tara:strand:+ start:6296 stop:7267 length:972 start_codon:yes stop_codon:yes gene_type:complete